MGRQVLIVLLAVLALSCSRPSAKAAPPPTRVWSDAEVLDYALHAQAEAMSRARIDGTPRSGVLGRHNGLVLAQKVWTNDVCCVVPSDLALVVYYQLPKGSDCASVGGFSETLRVPNGYSSAVRRFCFPAVFAEHWSEVAREMAP